MLDFVGFRSLFAGSSPAWLIFVVREALIVEVKLLFLFFAILCIYKYSRVANIIIDKQLCCRCGNIII